MLPVKYFCLTEVNSPRFIASMICKRATGACRPTLYFPFIELSIVCICMYHVCLAFNITGYFVCILCIMCRHLGMTSAYFIFMTEAGHVYHQQHKPPVSKQWVRNRALWKWDNFHMTTTHSTNVPTNVSISCVSSPWKWYVRFSVTNSNCTFVLHHKWSKIACRVITEEWMIPFAACHYWQSNNLFCCKNHSWCHYWSFCCGVC